MLRDANSKFDVVCIGDALVDVLVQTEVSVVEECGLTKGSMMLMPLAAAQRVHERVGSGIERSGGSAANTAAGLASLGARTGFIGRVAEDRLGQVFAADIRSLGVKFESPSVATTAGAGTGRCLILVTPDADRTMCTSLGVAAEMDVDDIDSSLVSTAGITYLEGYLFDLPAAKVALRHAIAVAHDAGRRVAMSLSDPFCVERHRSDFRDLVAHELDLVFGNRDEVCSLADNDEVEKACRDLMRPGLTITVTLGAKGALVWAWGAPAPTYVRAADVANVVDTTGAGDLYAAGFLWGLTQGYELERCARLGAIAAAEIISHVGARPEVDLLALIGAALREE